MASPLVVVSGPVGVGKSTVAAQLAHAWPRAVVIPIDTFTSFVVRGGLDPSSPEAGEQNHLVGGAAAITAMHFAEHGYAVVLDGHVFPDGYAPLAAACAARAIPVRHVLLRADLATCVERAQRRDAITDPGPAAVRRVWQRYEDLAPSAGVVVDATPPAADVAATVLAALALEP